jgi:hypothetical protein
MTVWLLPINKPAAGASHGRLHSGSEMVRTSLAYFDGGYLQTCVGEGPSTIAFAFLMRVRLPAKKEIRADEFQAVPIIWLLV